jgi:hypothetical protein
MKERQFVKQRRLAGTISCVAGFAGSELMNGRDEVALRRGR